MGVKNFVDYDNADAIIRKIDQKIDSNGAHEILNASGTELAAESKLQFKGGLSASDDSTNGKTVVSGDYPVFTWDAWIAMTEQEQEAYPDAIITDAPGIDGVLTLDMMTKLWENPDPTEDFDPQTITLSSDDYNFLVFETIWGCYTVVKGCDVRMSQMVPIYNGTGHNAWYREINYVSDTSYFATAGREQLKDTTSRDKNSIFIPVAIYGIKLQHQIDVSAVITPSSSPNHQFAIATTAWVANTGSDATEFPYVANIATTEFSDTFVPARVMLLGADGSDYPTAAEEADIALVDKYIEFSDEGVRLRATDTPTNALTLIVAGAVVGTRNMVPVAASDVVLSDNHTVEECLMASNDVPFRFAYDSTSQKYGYIIQNGGADTFVPFKSVELVDINPNNLTSGDDCYGFEFVKTGGGEYYTGNRIAVCGYKRMKIYTNPSYYSGCKYKFQLADGTFTAEFNATSGWSDYITIPSNAIGLWGYNGSGATLLNYYSLYAE